MPQTPLRFSSRLAFGCERSLHVLARATWFPLDVGSPF
uniref:Uncharacterized protein n=1 Tax=Arundo donax TaxID=35708 RepID=A0A0A8YIM7_ARUDO